MSSADTLLTPAQLAFLGQLQRLAIHYFLENQGPSGLVLDRQHNRAPLQPHGWYSTSATGMGLIAFALAAAPPYQLLTRTEAVRRVRVALETARDRLPNDHGMMPHFVDSITGAACGFDVVSTVDSSWLLAGGLWAAAFLQDTGLEALAGRLYERVDFHYWTAPEAPAARGLLRHGKGADGQFLLASWDRLNGETVFMYVLGAGAREGWALAPAVWSALRPFYGTVAGLRFNNADLGLYAFEYGLDLLDWQHWQAPGPVDLVAEARVATRANRLFCREAATRFRTYQLFWGLSDGDGPGDTPMHDDYRPYSPTDPLDGTAHLTATLAAVAWDPPAALENLERADHDGPPGLRGRYGFSNVNLDRHWVGRDRVGIDSGSVVIALDNYLHADRVRRVYQAIPYVRRGLERLGFVRRDPTADLDHPPTSEDPL